MGVLRLRTLHGVGLYRGDEELAAPPKRLLLLAYLLLEGTSRPLSRERIIDVFWPSADTERGRNSLRQALFGLRALLGEQAISSRGQELMLDPTIVSCDAIELLHASSRADHARVVALHIEPFFQIGGHTLDSASVEQWVESTRAKLRRLAAVSMRTLALDGSTPVDVSLEMCERLQQLAPYDEADARVFVERLLQQGDRSRALQEAVAFEARLLHDLELPPSHEFLRLIDRIRQGASTASSEGPKDATVAPAIELASASVRESASPTIRTRSRWRRALLPAVVVPLLALLGAVLRPAANENLIAVNQFDGLTRNAAPDALVITERLRGTLAALPGLEVASGTSGLLLGFTSKRPGTVIAGAVAQQAPTRWSAWATVRLPRADLLLSRIEVEAPTSDSLAALLADQISVVLATRRDMLLDWGRTVHRPTRFAAFAAYQQAFALTANGDAVGAVDAFIDAWRRDSTFLFAGVMAASNATASGQFERGDSLLRVLAGYEAAMLPLELYQYRRAVAWAKSLPQSALIESRSVIATEPRVPFLLSQYAEDAFYANHPAEALLAFDSLAVVLQERRQESDDAPIRAQALHQLGRYADELAVATRSVARYPAQPHMAALRIAPLAALGQVDTLVVMLAAIESRDSTRDIARLARSAAIELDAHGHTKGADRLRALGMEWLSRHPLPPNASITRRLNAIELLIDARDYVGADAMLKPLRDGSGTASLSVGQRSVYFNTEGTLAARRGDRAEALAWSDSLADLAQRGRAGVETYRRARIAAELGDVASGLRLLSQALEEGFITVRELHADPSIAVLRRQPRFIELVAPRPTAR